MTRSRFWITMLLIAIAGFWLGRMSSSLQLASIVKSGGGDAPLFPAPPHEAPAVADVASGDIVIELPVEGAAASATFIDVAGRAKREGGSLAIAVKDAGGSEIASATVDIDGLATDEYGRFSKTLTFASQPVGDGTVEISRASGGASVIRHVHFIGAEVAANGDIAVKIYLHNATLGPADDCSLVFPANRTIPAGSAAYRATIEALLKGPTASEKSAGYTTAIPASAMVKSVAADANGMVTADFSAGLDRGVAGSCRVQAIRAQIETTLRQFPETHDVTISVNGNADQALQP